MLSDQNRQILPFLHSSSKIEASLLNHFPFTLPLLLLYLFSTPTQSQSCCSFSFLQSQFLWFVWVCVYVCAMGLCSLEALPTFFAFKEQRERKGKKNRECEMQIIFKKEGIRQKCIEKRKINKER